MAAANAEPTRMDDVTPMVIQNLREIFTFRTDEELPRFITLLRETGSVIAGGFLLHALHNETDHNNAVEPRVTKGFRRGMARPDVDIYVPIEHASRFMREFLENRNPHGQPAMLQEYNIEWGAFKSTMYCQSFLRRNGIQTIYNCVIKNVDEEGDGRNIEFDVMIIRSNRTPLQVVNNFDLTFCQVWFDGDHVYASHPEDVRNKSGTLQGDYVNLFVQGNPFLQNRLQKYRTRGYEVRLDPVRLEEIGGNPLVMTPVCGEETREAILKHWTSRVILYWLLDVRDPFLDHDQPLPRDFRHIDGFMAVPLRLHEQNIPKGSQGDHFIQAHRQRDIRMKDTYPLKLNGYDSEDYEDDESLYPVLGNYYNQQWNADRHKLEYFRETNKLIEMIIWPNEYGIDIGRHHPRYYETMGRIFDSEYDDQRKEHYRPFYDALRERCIRKSNKGYVGYNSNNANDNNDEGDEEEVFDIHDHPLNRASTAEHIQNYLQASHMNRHNKNNVPCYSEGCNEPLTLSQVKYIVTPEFYRDYTRPIPMRSGLDQVIELFDAIKENTATVDPAGYGVIYHDTICPFCLQPVSRNEGCMYLTHAREDDFHPQAPFCQTRHLVREVYDKYTAEAGHAVDVDDYGPFALKLEICAQCGRPCNSHHHFSSAAPYDHYLAGLGQGAAEYGLCPGQGRAELFARILAIREVYRANNGIDSMEERRLAAIAADNAPNNEALMARGQEILAMQPAERVWGNAELPREKHYTNEAYQQNGANPGHGANQENWANQGNEANQGNDGDEKEEPAPGADAERRRRIRERYEQLFREINEMADEEMAEQFQPIADALQEIGEIDGPEFNEVQNLDHYEAELDRIEQMIGDLAEPNFPNNEIFNGGRFKRSRKKHPRRKQKTLRKLLKKLK